MSEKLTALIEWYADFSIRRKWLLIPAMLVLIFGVGAGARTIKFETKFRIWHPPDSENVKAYDVMLEKFGSDDAVIVAFRDPDRGMLHNHPLQTVRRLTDAIWQIKGVKRVDSLANFAVIRASRLEHESPALVAGAGWVAAAGDKSEIFVWDTATWTQRVLRGHAGNVEHLEVAKDGVHLFSGGVDRTVRMWSVTSGALVHTFRGLPELVSDLAVSPDGSRVYAATYRGVHAWDIASKKRVLTLDAHTDYVTQVALSADGSRVYTASHDVVVFDATSGEVTGTWSGHTSWVNALALSTDGLTLLSAADDGKVIAWGPSGEPRTLIDLPGTHALSVGVEPSGESVVVGFSDGSVRSVPLSGAAPIVSRVHDDWVNAVLVGADGRVYSASRDRNAAMHVPGQGPQILILAAHRGSVRALTLAPDEERLYTLGDEGDVYVWDTTGFAISARLSRVLAPAGGAQEGLPVGSNDGKLSVLNGFRYPLDIRFAGEVRATVAGGKSGEIAGLPVGSRSSCETEECGPGQYCDYEADEPYCATQLVIEAVLPGTDVTVWRGETSIAADRVTAVRIPSDEPYSLSEVAKAPFDARTRVGAFKQAFRQPQVQAALQQVLGADADDDGVFIDPALAEALAAAIRGQDGGAEAAGDAVRFLTTHAQDKLSPIRLPVQPYRLREAGNQMMRPPDPSAKGLALNETRDATSIVAEIHQDEEKIDALVNEMRIRAELEALVEAEAAASGYEFFMNGDVIQDTSFLSYAERDVTRLLPFFFGLIALLLIIVYRRPSGLFVPLGLVILSITFAMGASTLLGAALNNMTVVVPQVVLASCIGDAIHIFNTYVDKVRKGSTPNEATKYAVTANMMPCLWTTASTAIGFFSLMTSRIVPIATFGWMAGIGVVAAFVVSFTVMPGVISSLGVPKRYRDGHGDAPSGFDHAVDRFMVALANYVNRSTGALLFIGAAVFSFACYGLTLVEFDTNAVNSFAPESEFRKSVDFIEQNISGPYGLKIMVDTGERGGIRKLEHLETLRKLQDHIKTTPQVVRASSIVDIMQSMNRVMNGDARENYRLPASDGHASSYYDAYTFSLSAGSEITNQVSGDESTVLFDLRLLNMSAGWIIDWGNALNAWIAEEIPGAKVVITAKSWLYSAMLKEVGRGFFENVGSAVLLISILVMFLARSFRVGFVACLANIVPLVATIGFLALAGITLDISALVSCCVAMGIVVDDTIHYISKYKRLRDAGQSHDEATVGTIRDAGKAMLFTTLVLCAGFGIFMWTDYQVNKNFGLTVAAMLTLGMLFDLMVLPAALKVLSKPD